MATSIRLARGGAKKRPYYRIVIADKRAPRDGRFIEKVGTYNPMLPKDHADRVRLDEDRIKHWLGNGAQPTDRVSRFLESAGLAEAKKRDNPNKAKPSKKTLELLEEKRQKAEEAAEAAKEAEAAATETVEEAPAEDASAEEAKEDTSES